MGLSCISPYFHTVEIAAEADKNVLEVPPILRHLMPSINSPHLSVPLSPPPPNKKNISPQKMRTVYNFNLKDAFSQG